MEINRITLEAGALSAESNDTSTKLGQFSCFYDSSALRLEGAVSRVVGHQLVTLGIDNATTAGNYEIIDSDTLNLFSESTRDELLSKLSNAELDSLLSSFRQNFDRASGQSAASAASPAATGGNDGNIKTLPDGSLTIIYRFEPSKLIRTDHSELMLKFLNNSSGDAASDVKYKIEFDQANTKPIEGFAPKGLDIRVIDKDTFLEGSDAEPSNYTITIKVEHFDSIASSKESASTEIAVVPEYPVYYTVLLLIGVLTSIIIFITRQRFIRNGIG